MDWINTKTVAEIVGVPAGTIRNWRRAGVFSHTWVTPGGHTRFDRLEAKLLKHHVALYDSGLRTCSRCRRVTTSVEAHYRHFNEGACAACGGEFEKRVPRNGS